MTQAEEAELDRLQDQYSVLAARKHALRKQMEPITAELKTIEADIHRTGTKISKLKHSNEEMPHITDHAVVRYLERVDGVNIEEVRRKILGHDKAFRNGNVIVTVLGDKPEEQEI